MQRADDIGQSNAREQCRAEGNWKVLQSKASAFKIQGGIELEKAVSKVSPASVVSSHISDLVTDPQIGHT